MNPSGPHLSKRKFDLPAVWVLRHGAYTHPSEVFSTEQHEDRKALVLTKSGVLTRVRTGQLYNITPHGIVADDGGLIWTSNCMEKKIKSMTEEGRLTGVFDLDYYPVEVAVLPNDRLVVAAYDGSKNTSQLRFYQFFRRENALESTGESPEFPHRVRDMKVCAQKGEIYVLRSEDVCVFASNGECLRRIGDGLKYPTSIALTADGCVLICEHLECHVLLWSCEGTFICQCMLSSPPWNVFILPHEQVGISYGTYYEIHKLAIK